MSLENYSKGKKLSAMLIFSYTNYDMQDNTLFPACTYAHTHHICRLRDTETYKLPRVFSLPQDITALMATQVHHNICCGIPTVSGSSSRTIIRKCSIHHLLYPSIETQAYILFQADSDKLQACGTSPSCLLCY